MRKKDFLSKVYIALNECAESIYWLDLLHDTDYFTDIEYQSMLDDCNEMRKMLSSTTKTMNTQLSAGGNENVR